MKEYYLGVDLGTSSIKGILRSVDGELVKAKVFYDENSVRGWKGALKTLISTLNSKIREGKIAAVAFSSQVGTYIVDGESVISWQSSVGREELEEIRKKIPQKRFIEEISMPHPDILSYPLPRLLYIQKRYGKGREVMQPKDFLLRELTGERVTDIYSSRGIVRLETGEYAEGIMRDLEIDCVLPTVKKPTDFVGFVTKSAEENYGLTEGTPVYSGCNDFYAGLLGMGVYKLGDAFDLSGTSEHVGWISDALQTDGFVSGGYFNGFCTYGGTKASGVSCDFAIKNFGIDDLSLEEELRRKPPVFLPYLSGERAPIYDENARGVYFGLDCETTKRQMAYATLEGVTFSLYDIAERMGMPKPRRLICGGGSAKNELMASIKAELFGCEVAQVKENDTSALGAVMLAMLGNGAFADVAAAVDACVTYEPSVQASGKYRGKLLKRFAIYRELYDDLKDTFKRFNQIKES